MASSSAQPSIATLLAKPDKTSNDLQQVLDGWHQDLLRNEKHLLEHAHQLDQKQDTLTRSTASLIDAQDLLIDLEGNLEEFQLSIDNLTKYNDELEKNIDGLNKESKTLPPAILSNVKTEQDRAVTYELMESVDNHLDELDEQMKKLNQILRMNTDGSILTTTDELQTCFEDIHQLRESLKQMKFEEK